MRLFIDDPTEDPDEPERTDNPCQICGKPESGPECPDCEEREFRRWER